MSPGTTATYESFAHLNKLLYLTAAWCLTWVVSITAYYNKYQEAAWLLAGVTALLALAIVAICKASRQTVILKRDTITLILPTGLDKLVFTKQTYSVRVTALLAVDIIDHRRCHIRIRTDHHELELKYFLQYQELVAAIGNLQNRDANI